MRILLVNGRVHSPFARDASSMLVEDDAIAWLGDDASGRTMAADKVIDLDGAFVTPGFVDSHFHTTATGLALLGLDLSTSASLADALDALEKHARKTRGRPVWASGWDETRWPEGRPPTAAELDRASYGGAVYLARTDAHSAVISSALQASVPGLASMAGYHGPDGLVTKDAHHAARTVARDAITASQRAEAQSAALQAAARAGIVAVHEMAGPEISGPDDLVALLDLARHGGVPEVFGYWGELHGIKQAAELGAVGVGGDLFCDGSFGSHTAGLSEPYEDAQGTSGYLRFDTDELVRHLISCSEAGVQTGFHAIGDAAIAQVVEAMQLAAATAGAAAVFGAGHRIEHAELIPDVTALSRVGLIASVQPAFDATWGGTEGMYARRLGVDRALATNPFARLAAEGVPLAFGSDSPVTPIDPWAAVRAACHPTNQTHALSPRAAFAAHTRGGWRAARAEADGSGVLMPGSPATYAIFEAGSLGVDAPDERVSRWSTDERAAVPGLPDLAPGASLPRCLATVLRGRTIFDTGVLA
jgi:predicted amidohydrolase YtcJ